MNQADIFLWESGGFLIALGLTAMVIGEILNRRDKREVDNDQQEHSSLTVSHPTDVTEEVSDAHS